MTTNYQRALDLADHIADIDESTHELVKQLHTAGLLMPDLPKPVQLGDWGVREWRPFGEGGGGFWVSTAGEGHPVIVHVAEAGVALNFDPVAARAWAYTILAAADHTEGTKNES